MSDYGDLRMWAEMFQDAQQARIAAGNRISRGAVESIVYQGHIDNLKKTEHECKLWMVRSFRKTAPAGVVAWQKGALGIGEHQLSRLLGQIGDPVWATPAHWEGTGSSRELIWSEPYQRTVGELWSYCGHGDPTRKRRAGMTADEAMALGRPLAKSLVFQMAESTMKAGGPYRAVYDLMKEKYEDRTHVADCVRCGPSGKPAKEGSPWSKAHQHAAALRYVGKMILKDLWLVAQDKAPLYQPLTSTHTKE